MPSLALSPSNPNRLSMHPSAGEFEAPRHALMATGMDKELIKELISKLF
jgi:hypothetical protein